MSDDFDYLSDYWGGEGDGDEPDQGDWLSEPSSAEKAFLEELLGVYGIKDFNEVTINFTNDINPRELRGDRFATMAEAIMYLHDIGVLGFSNIVYYEEEDLYGARIPETSATPNIG